jgi:geranylgeranyl diphosphate synthase type I
LRRLVEARLPELARVNSWGPDTAKRLLQFAIQGKMIRGGLVLLGYEAHANRTSARSVLLAAAALEIVHSSLLIHDDIMDNDRIRRGARTVFAQYEEMGRRAKAADPSRFGLSMGICAGDVGYFLAWDTLARLPIDLTRRSALLALVARELAYVGLGQMQDVAFGSFPKVPTREEVVSLYLYKTARYTFSLPLMAGALLAGVEGREIDALASLGEKLGVIFQARDDILGMFGKEKETGKPVGVDIREGKKTLLYLELMRRARGAEKRALAALFGKNDLTSREIERVREAIETLGARAALNTLMERLEAEAMQIIAALPLAEKHRDILRSISARGLTRKS